jgi:hypothetical protein
MVDETKNSTNYYTLASSWDSCLLLLVFIFPTMISVAIVSLLSGYGMALMFVAQVCNLDFNPNPNPDPGPNPKPKPNPHTNPNP